MLHPKKSFGQHFLHDELIAERIADSLSGRYNQVLEVGPGMGMLTKYLLAKPGIDLKVSEADRDMVAYLNLHMPALKDRILEGDFLKLNMKEVFQGEYAVIGNYPYNISSQIFIAVIDNRDRIPEMSGMFQKEVAERISALPDSDAYGILSVFAQAWFEPEYLFTVKPGSFNPPPKVMSGVIRLTRKENYTLDCNEKLFRTVVRSAFAQRRKMLRNTLSALLPREYLMDDPFYTRRAETLGVEDFVRITQKVTAMNHPSES